jgi:energy-coupling factor transporter ATP-binding protein EcfA2
MSIIGNLDNMMRIRNLINRKIKKQNSKRKRDKMKPRSESRKWSNMSDSVTPTKYSDGLSKNGYNMELDEYKGDVQSEYFLAAASLNDHFITKVVAERTDNGLNTHTIKEELVTSRVDWFDYIDSNWDSYQLIQYGKTDGVVFDKDELNFFDYSISSNSVEVKAYGSKEFVEFVHEDLLSKFQIAACHIEWIYSSDGSSINIPLMPEKLPISEMYPFLDGETVEEYYNRFMESSAAILLLIGPPGTGKTTFIRGLLHHAQRNAIVTYDEKILERDYVFAQFIEGDAGVMVIEDADNFLKPRDEGNLMMHRFLNVGDGLISLKGKKLIFSTNLPSVRDVDVALTRPGRCFDVITFNNYTLDEAKKLAGKLDLPFDEKESKEDTYSLAEVFFKQQNTNPKKEKKMGFV